MVSKKFYKIAKDLASTNTSIFTDFVTVNPLRSCGASNKLSNFINRCIKSGNPEALYMEEAGIEQLKSAISEGYQVATYVYGAILVCHGFQAQRAHTSLFSQPS
ncbi:hypothetical protein DVH24_019771 [Malus domestica]|uniref:At2g35280-like TPR domain-containing protein n=1 Tax=Malus domestica TaxID=3750 RepID=A0A498I706_MALDO|nr:hypothetical protein DVH24_019771 [Malus domestica]